MNIDIKKPCNRQRVVFLIILLYFSLALFNVNYPGLNTDEAFNGVVSNNILRDVSDIAQGRTQFLQCYVSVFGKIFPIMAAQYYSPVIPYLIHPFIYLFGANTFSLRFGSVFILAIFLLFVYQLCKIWFGRRVGLLAALLTATNLAFVQYSRVGLFRCEIFVMLFFWIGLFFLIEYSKNKNLFYFVLSFLFFGLGFSTKITFLYYLVGLTIAYLVIGRKLNLLGQFNVKKAIIALLSFCLGSFFIIIYNIKEPWITIKQLLLALTDLSSTGRNTTGLAANNLNYLHNLGVRLSDLSGLLKGDIFTRLDWGVIKISVIERISPIMTSLVVVALISVFFFTLFSSRLSRVIRRRILFLYAIYLTLFFFTPFTLSGFNQGHLLIIFPFPQVVLALFLVYLWRTIKRKSKLFAMFFVWFLIVPTIFFNIYMNIYFNTQMEKTGGYGRWSTAISDLVDYLQKNHIASPVMFGYGLHANLMFLTDNKVVPDIYDKFYSQPVISAYTALFYSNKPIFYLTLTPEQSKLEELIKFWAEGEKGLQKRFYNMFMDFSGDENTYHKDLFMNFVKESGRRKELEKVFLNRAGHPVYWLYKIY